MIETSLKEAKQIYNEAKLGTDVNYLFVHPPSVEEMAIRLIRTKPGRDTAQSLLIKQNSMKADIEEAKNLKWLTKTIQNGGSKEDFLKQAALYIVF